MKLLHRTVTPELAAKYLEGNTHNRTLRQSTVERYARQMKKGLWKDNGQTISFSTDGTLLDGQHRLWAIVESGVPVNLAIAEGVDPEVFSSIDTGSGRSSSDVVQIAGFTYSKEVAGAVQHIYRYCNNKMKAKGAGCSHEEVLNHVRNNPGLIESAERVKRVKLVGATMATALHYMFSQVDAEKADQFFEAMRSGEFQPSMGAVRAYRERIIKARTINRGSGSRRDRFTKVEESSMAIKAWNAFSIGKNLRIIRVGLNEEFPAINGLPASFIRRFEDQKVKK